MEVPMYLVKGAGGVEKRDNGSMGQMDQFAA